MLFNYSLNLLQNKLISLQEEYARIVAISGILLRFIESEDTDTIYVLHELQTRIEDLNNCVEIIEENEKYYLTHMKEI